MKISQHVGATVLDYCCYTQSVTPVNLETPLPHGASHQFGEARRGIIHIVVPRPSNQHYITGNAHCCQAVSISLVLLRISP